MQAEDGIGVLVRSRGVGDEYKRQAITLTEASAGWTGSCLYAFAKSATLPTSLPSPCLQPALRSHSQQTPVLSVTWNLPGVRCPSTHALDQDTTWSTPSIDIFSEAPKAWLTKCSEKLSIGLTFSPCLIPNLRAGTQRGPKALLSSAAENGPSSSLLSTSSVVAFHTAASNSSGQR